MRLQAPGFRLQEDEREEGIAGAGRKTSGVMRVIAV
jgi:hypothetical protein